MYAFLIILHVIISIGLVVTVLLQSGKGGGLAGTFGGGEVEAVFGSRGIASRLTKLTSIFAVLFFLSCIMLALVSTPKQAGKSAIQESLKNQPQTTAPATAPTTVPKQVKPIVNPTSQPQGAKETKDTNK